MSSHLRNGSLWVSVEVTFFRGLKAQTVKVMSFTTHYLPDSSDPRKFHLCGYPYIFVRPILDEPFHFLVNSETDVVLVTANAHSEGVYVEYRRFDDVPMEFLFNGSRYMDVNPVSTKSEL